MEVDYSCYTILGQNVVRLIHQTLPSSNVNVLYLCKDIFPPRKYAKSISLKNPRDQLGMKHELFQAFPTCWQDMAEV